MFSDSFITPSLSSSPSLSSLKIEEKKKRRKREKYMKITDEQRDQLLDLVFFQNEKVKKAALKLNLNYSSAKTILFLHRKKYKNNQKGSKTNITANSKRCICKALPRIFIHSKVEMITMQGGKEIFKKNVIFHGVSCKEQSAFNTFKSEKDSVAQIINNVCGMLWQPFLQ